MPFLDSNGVRIAYTVEGDGPPILLVHGFASSFEGNWRKTGWSEMLRARGRQVIGIDCRGHGRSERPHGLELYSGGQMLGDLLRLLDHLNLARADFLGYSMGAWMMLPLLVNHAARIHCAVLGAAGAPLPETRSLHQVILAEFEGQAPPAGASPQELAVARGFRAFAELVGNDLVALSCVLRSGVLRADMLDGLERCTRPVLVAGGDRDGIAGDVASLSAHIPSSRLLQIVGGDHLSTLKSAEFREGILDFLDEHGMA